MDDPRRRGHDLEPVERLLAPAEEGIALAVPHELELGVPEHRTCARVLVDLDRVVDDEVGRKHGLHARRVAAEVLHRVSHSGEIDDGRHAREVLVEHSCRCEAHLATWFRGRHPRGDRFDVRVGTGAERVLEQDAEREGEPLDVVRRLQRVEAEDLERAVSDCEGRRRDDHVSILGEGDHAADAVLCLHQLEAAIHVV